MKSNHILSPMMAIACCTIVALLLITSTSGAPAPATMSIYDMLDGDQMLTQWTELLDALGAAGDADEHNAPKKLEQPSLMSSGRQPATTTTTVERCRLPVRKGLCRALIPRWNFDAATGECKEFKFGGCDGNGNNFETQQQCENMCRSKDI